MSVASGFFRNGSSSRKTPGAFAWEETDAFLKTAAANGVEVNAILMGSIPWSKEKAHTFPMSDLEAWSRYVAAVVERYHGQVRHWEVWNEGNGGFNDGHHTAVDYAKLVAASYAAAKQADPQAQVGLTVASFDLPYLRQTMLALARDGHAGQFDYLCVHPYEIGDGLESPDGEIPFLWMTRSLRQTLKVSAPARAEVPIWISEVGRRVDEKRQGPDAERGAAKLLVKLYTMALAQGIHRTQWFEAQDPPREEAGFGLLKRDGSPRATFQAFQRMTEQLGAVPKYSGWLALGEGGRGYGFVFEGAAGPVLAAWMPAGETEAALHFAREVKVINALSGEPKTVSAGGDLSLTDSPVWILGLDADSLKKARWNAGSNFPWGGDHAGSSAVSWEAGKTGSGQGVFAVGSRERAKTSYPDGTTGLVIPANQSMRYFVHPTFADLQTEDYYIRLTVRRTEARNAGMNLRYEIADSQGRMPYANVGEWFSLGPQEGWQTHTWHVTKACFAKMWGHDFYFQPEKSIPIVVGRVEVSKVPFLPNVAR